MADFIDGMPVTEGLGAEGKEDWPSGGGSLALAESPISRLRPGSELHERVLQHLLDRIKMSEQEMVSFYPRWNVQEQKVQAYVNLPDWEKTLKAMNDAGAPPKVVSLVVPYTFATISTIVTYLIHAFAGRKPMFQVGSYKKETVQNAAMMELVLQYNADHTRLVRHLWQFLQDGETYGLGVLRTKWRKDLKSRTVWTPAQQYGYLNVPLGTQLVKTREERVVYAGNDVAAVDPFMFLPDPRVPMTEVNKSGEFVFWKTFEGLHSLKVAEAQGQLRWVNHIGEMPRDTVAQGNSVRNLLSGGSSSPGDPTLAGGGSFRTKSFKMLHQGTVEIIPRELGLGESEVPEKWLFTLGNKRQIIQAEPFQADHGMHPVVVIEPYSLGYGFGQAGIADYLGPLQDGLSWLFNSHIDNVRTALNNMFVVDPSMVEVKDLEKPGAGKIIRLKKSAYGSDVRAALQQMQVYDVTQGHVKDFELFMRMGDAMSSITDNLRGMQDQGGRKSATEARMSGEAGASRLAAHTRLISAQGMVDLAEQMCLNIQQNLEQEFYLDLVGLQGLQSPLQPLAADPMRVSPEMLVGDFYYPINDGTLPIDRVALLDVWKELFLAVGQDPQLRQEYSLPGIFDYLAELGGAKNLDQFKLQPGQGMPMQAQPQSPEQISQGVQQGNLVPLGQAPGQTPGLPPQPPGQRMAGRMG